MALASLSNTRKWKLGNGLAGNTLVDANWTVTSAKIKCPSFLNRPFPYPAQLARTMKRGGCPCVQFHTSQCKVGAFVYGKEGAVYTCL